MTHDKQLVKVELDLVVEKRRLGQPLNSKEFAVLNGISYSAARAWFRQPGFPVLRGVVFWEDFEQWRKAKTGLKNGSEILARSSGVQSPSEPKSPISFTGRAARIIKDFN
jgi:hypothetical protein